MLLKAAMLIAATLLLGAGLYRYWLLGRATKVTVAMGLVGVAALLTFSFLDLRAALLNVRPSADASLLWRYAATSGHGVAVQVRAALALALGVLAVIPDATGRSVGGAYLVAAVGLLSTFSVISHGAVMGGWLPLLSDLVHFLAAGLWSGAVFALVLAPLWREERRPALVVAMRKMSGLGLAAVLVLALTGVFNALVHAGDPERFVGSTYLLALAVKLAMVAATIALAGANRFRFLPRLLSGRELAPLRAAMRVEAVLLLAVLVATGWLSTTAVPHGSEVSVDALRNAGKLIDYLGR